MKRAPSAIKIACHPESRDLHLAYTVSSRAKRISAEPRDLLLLFHRSLHHYRVIPSEAYFSGAEGPAFAFSPLATPLPCHPERSAFQRSRGTCFCFCFRFCSCLSTPYSLSLSSRAKRAALRAAHAAKDLRLLLLLSLLFPQSESNKDLLFRPPPTDHCRVIPSEAHFSGAEGPAFALPPPTTHSPLRCHPERSGPRFARPTQRRTCGCFCSCLCFPHNPSRTRTGFHPGPHVPVF